MLCTVRIRYAAKTDVGMKRAHNEDYFALIEDEQLFIVADGMGGHASGEVASKLAADVMNEFYKHSRDADATWPYRYDHSLSYPENRMVASIRLANQRIHESAQKNQQLRGMGTTIVALLVQGNNGFVHRVLVVVGIGENLVDLGNSRLRLLNAGDRPVTLTLEFRSLLLRRRVLRLTARLSQGLVPGDEPFDRGGDGPSVSQRRGLRSGSGHGHGGGSLRRVRGPSPRPTGCVPAGDRRADHGPGG